jgi:hypothetical protein
MGVLKHFMPTRDAVTPSVVADLDKLIAEPVAFKFQGKVYTLEPVSTRIFMQLADSLGKAQALVKAQVAGESVTSDEIYLTYVDVVKPLCPEFGIEVLKKMTLPQVHALINLVMKQVTGQPMNLDESEKKKRTV